MGDNEKVVNRLLNKGSRCSGKYTECDGICKEPDCGYDCQCSACHKCQRHHDEQLNL